MFLSSCFYLFDEISNSLELVLRGNNSLFRNCSSSVLVKISRQASHEAILRQNIYGIEVLFILIFHLQQRLVGPCIDVIPLAVIFKYIEILWPRNKLLIKFNN